MCPVVGVEGSELCNEPIVYAGVHFTLDILVLAKQRCIFSLQTSLRGKVCFDLPVLPWQYVMVTTQACSKLHQRLCAILSKSSESPLKAVV